ncbi:IS200/IS605 family element RNA-guided endonuclease TnpB [Clostridium sp.]|uniref:IS200/IS605 family element RNA-guided endonuclease TnpB n=1 Tax=Clostridium sp. TaxID=1506 RepID=UPI0026034641|nr:IS200/IS605 family element RNA-guided endonuclease TnpB [Clostridium sp.]
MLKAYKYRIYPNLHQEILINKTLGCTRFVFNYFLDLRIKTYELESKSLSYNDNAKVLTSLKKDLTWLKEVDSISLQQTLKDLDKAYKNFFRDKSIGFPKFKSKKNNKKSFRTQNVNSNIEVLDDYIKLPKIGLIKYKNSRPFNGKINSATISKTSTNKYFVSILVETENFQLPKLNTSIGIDLGIKYFAVMTTGEVIANPKFLRNLEYKLRFQQRSLSRKKLGSKNWYKQKLIVARLHEKITNARKDFLHKLSTRLINENQIICLEDLQIKEMLKTKEQSKNISEVSWAEFRNMIEYKSSWYGRIVSVVDKSYPSSQLCSTCGYINKEVKNLNLRNWTCPCCKSNHKRDYNASINILIEGLRIITG